MGRWSTGVQTTSGAKRVELSYLQKHKMLVKGYNRSGQLSWSSNGSANGNIGIECNYFGNEDDYIRLFYTQTKDGVATKVNYKISLIERDSNLGKGKVLYMVCSQSGNLCRILYMAYGSTVFKCRQAYQNRIYYPIQTSSKMDRANSRFFEIERQLTAEDKKRSTWTYNGNLTKRAIRKQRLEKQYSQKDEQRNQVFLQQLYKFGYS